MTKAVSTLLLVVFLLSQLNGCSLVGLGIGSIIDQHNSQKVTPVSKSKLEGVRQGSQFIVTLDNGDTLHGTYCGFERISQLRYSKLYAERRGQKPEGILLPELGESITITNTQDRESKYEFLGFGYKHIFVTSSGKAKSSKIPLGTVSKLSDSNGNVITGRIIRKLISETTIPIFSAISTIYLGGRLTDNQLSPTKLKETVDAVQVEMDRVSEIQGKLKTNRKLTWLLVGAGIDLALIGLVIAVAASGDMSLNMSFGN